MAALKLAEHPQALEQRSRLKAPQYQELQRDERRPAATRKERLQELAEAQDARAEALPGVCLSVDRALAQNVRDHPAWVQVSAMQQVPSPGQRRPALSPREAPARPDAPALASEPTSQLPRQLPARQFVESACAPTRRARHQSSSNASSFR